MILLDNDHASILRMGVSARRNRLVARMGTTIDETFTIPIIAVEESMRGWMASIAKERKVHRQIGPYRELGELFTFYAQFSITEFNDRAATLFETMGKLRISGEDRKIAAIALANDALLLTANRRDFDQVPNLRFENWMDEPVV